MAFSVQRNRRGQIECSDESGMICFELARGQASLSINDIVEIDGGIDLPGFDQWLQEALLAAQAFCSAKSS